MKYIQIFFSVFLLFFSTVIYGQTLQNGQVYTDYIRDEKGNPIQGLTVKVSGTGISDITDSNGKFSVKAKKGDRISISKNGKIIDSYFYNGKNDYFIYDTDNHIRKTDYQVVNQYQQAIDSALFYVKKAPLKSIDFIEKALKETNLKKQKAKAFAILGDAYFNLKQYDLAKGNYLLAQDTFKKDIPLQLKIAQSDLNLNHFDTAISKFKALLDKKRLSKKQKTDVLLGLANAYFLVKNYSLALSHFDEVYKIANEENWNSILIEVNDKIGKIHVKQGNIDASKTYFNRSVVSAKQENKKKAIIQSEKIADFYGNNNAVAEEIKLRKKNLKEIESIESEMNESDENLISKPKIKKDIGNALIKQKQYNEAIVYFEESAQEASASNDIITEKEAIEGLTKAYVALGDDKNALKNYKLYTKLVDLLYQKKEEEIKKAVTLGKELFKKQNRITSLEKDRKFNENKLKLIQTEQQLIEENSKRQKLLIYSLFTGLLLVSLALYYLYKSNKERKKNNKILALKHLRTQMNPHFIFNALNSVNGFIANNNERAANKYLTDFSKLMRSVLENSEKDFIPLPQELKLLEVYLKLEHTRFKDKFDYQINIDSNIDLEIYSIPPMLLQPYVENAIWHGLRYKNKKGLLKIDVNKTTNETIQICIEDDGIGREKSKELKSKNQLKHKSKGMQNIKQRIDLLNSIDQNKIQVTVQDLHVDYGTKVILILKK